MGALLWTFIRDVATTRPKPFRFRFPSLPVYKIELFCIALHCVVFYFVLTFLASSHHRLVPSISLEKLYCWSQRVGSLSQWTRDTQDGLSCRRTWKRCSGTTWKILPRFHFALPLRMTFRNFLKSYKWQIEKPTTDHFVETFIVNLKWPHCLVHKNNELLYCGTKMPYTGYKHKIRRRQDAPICSFVGSSFGNSCYWCSLLRRLRGNCLATGRVLW